MLNSKQIIFLAIFIFLSSGIGYFFSSMSASSQQVKVALLWQENELDCTTVFKRREGKQTWFIEQAQFFISNMQVGSKKSGWQRINLVPSAFQTGNTVLLGTNCREEKQQKLIEHNSNWHIEFEPNTEIREGNRIRFTLGVPFAVNHLNPISQASPLNLPSMFWVWQTGHKFMRLELANHNEQWLFHLGSTGCKSASVMRSPKQACLYPNSFNFELPIVLEDNHNIALNLDLAALLNNVELTAASSCQSQHDSLSCQQLFANLSVMGEGRGSNKNSAVFNSVKVKHTSKGIAVE